MRNSQHADERLDAEQADDTEEGDPAQHQDEHWLGPEMFVSDPDEDAADPEYADQCELMLEQLQEDVHMLLHQLQQEAGPYDPERPSRARVEGIERLLSELGR
jgi:hypothetical protein